MAPMNNRMQSVVMTSGFQDRKWNVFPTCSGTCSNTVANSTDPKIMNTPKMPRAKPKSPTRLTTKALIAAALALGLWNQKPIRR